MHDFNSYQVLLLDCENMFTIIWIDTHNFHKINFTHGVTLTLLTCHHIHLSSKTVVLPSLQFSVCWCVFVLACLLYGCLETSYIMLTKVTLHRISLILSAQRHNNQCMLISSQNSCFQLLYRYPSFMHVHQIIIHYHAPAPVFAVDEVVTCWPAQKQHDVLWVFSGYSI